MYLEQGQIRTPLKAFYTDKMIATYSLTRLQNPNFPSQQYCSHTETPPPAFTEPYNTLKRGTSVTQPLAVNDWLMVTGSSSVLVTSNDSTPFRPRTQLSVVTSDPSVLPCCHLPCQSVLINQSASTYTMCGKSIHFKQEKWSHCKHPVWIKQLNRIADASIKYFRWISLKYESFRWCFLISLWSKEGLTLTCQGRPECMWTLEASNEMYLCCLSCRWRFKNCICIAMRLCVTFTSSSTYKSP